jgi:hypothetical protein
MDSFHQCRFWSKCTTGKERRISRWEHEAVLEAVQARLDRNPAKMRERRQTVEHPFGTIKPWMGATHFQMKTLKNVSTEMALHVLAYNNPGIGSTFREPRRTCDLEYRFYTGWVKKLPWHSKFNFRFSAESELN